MWFNEQRQVGQPICVSGLQLEIFVRQSKINACINQNNFFAAVLVFYIIIRKNEILLPLG